MALVNFQSLTKQTTTKTNPVTTVDGEIQLPVSASTAVKLEDVGRSSVVVLNSENFLDFLLLLDDDLFDADLLNDRLDVVDLPLDSHRPNLRSTVVVNDLLENDVLGMVAGSGIRRTQDRDTQGHETQDESTHKTPTFLKETYLTAGTGGFVLPALSNALTALGFSRALA